jgi:hypothetical protein
MSPARRLLTAGLILVALALLYPGVTRPVLSMSGTIEKSDVARLGVDLLAGEEEGSQTRQMLSAITSFMGLDRVEGQLTVYDSSRSIWSMARELARTGNLLVALLIMTFSVVVPAFKLCLQLVAMLAPQAALRDGLLWLNGALSKWSMADVFVMAMLIAYMAGRAGEQGDGMLVMQARLEPGFYYFLAYCLFSVLAGLLLQRPPAPAATADP